MDYHDGKLVFATDEGKKAFILQHQDEFPERVKRAIREASLEKPEVFLRKVQLSVETFCCHRLNDEIDTRQAVELAIRCFPEFLGIRRIDLRRNRYNIQGPLYRYRLFPIRHIAEYSRSVSFVPLFAKIAIDMQIFEDSSRGGLVPAEGRRFSRIDNVFEPLGKNEFDDTKLVAVIRELRESNLMTKADIRKYYMIRNIGYMRGVTERFRYLIDWDPSLLVPGPSLSIYHHLLPTPKKLKSLPESLQFERYKGDIHSITLLCEMGLKYYPTELGFLFDPVYVAGGCFGKGKKMSLYEFGCDRYGKAYMQGILGTFMCAQMKKDPSFTRKALGRAAAMGGYFSIRWGDYYKASVQSIFWLLQQDPTLLCNQYHREIPSESQSRKP